MALQSPIQLKPAETISELSGILALQAQNLKGAQPEARQRTEGFVTVQHTLPLIQHMNELAPQVIAVQDSQVVGYALTMVNELEHHIPVLQPMFQMLNSLSYQGKAIRNRSFYVMGQICIGEGFRGQGLFPVLYHTQQRLLKDQFDCCITEVSTSNPRSMRAHEKVEFETIHQFQDETDEWNILLWDWKKGAGFPHDQPGLG